MLELCHQILVAQNVVSGYGKKQILNGISLEVYQGEIIAIIGHNGAGKSTLLKAIFGVVPIWKGQIVIDGTAINKPVPREMLKKGISFAPQGNRIFTDLTVQENFEIGGAMVSDKVKMKEGIESVLSLFPALKPHLRDRAGILSGGEKQMLALANVMISRPRMLLLDEPSLGLAPGLVTQALEHIQEINRISKLSVLIVEQKVREVLKIAQRVYVLRNGLVSYSGVAEDLRDEAKMKEVYL